MILIGYHATKAYRLHNPSTYAIINDLESWDWQKKDTSNTPLMNILLSDPCYEERNATDEDCTNDRV
jgi:hypothetical protein